MLTDRCYNCMEDKNGNTVCPHCGFNHSVVKSEPHVLPRNTVLKDKYLIGKVLGQGGFGITYIGFDIVLEMKVAIKEYFPAHIASRDPENHNVISGTQNNSDDKDAWKKSCDDFLFEARKMAKINLIPEIVSVRETFEENNTSYIVMDYIPGMTLKEYVLKNGVFSYSDCVELMLPLIEGLDKVHRQGIIHRDISPDNLMITPEGKLYLLDLGTAKDLRNTREKQVSASKIGFSPIEQNSSNGNIGPWTDVYALAASIYYCVYGKLIPSSMERFSNDTLKFAKKAKKPIKSNQINVLKKALAVHSEFRYKNAIDFYLALKESVTVKNKRSRKILLVIIGIIALLGMATGGHFIAVNKPWLQTVEFCMPMFQSSYLSIPGEYEYFTDSNGSLNRVTYNTEKESFFINEAEVIYQSETNSANAGVVGIAAADDFLYFTYYGGEGNADYLVTMDFDGTNQKKILKFDKYNHSAPSYVKFSDGSEYFYYSMDDSVEASEVDEDTTVINSKLFRYNLKEDKVENVTSKTITSFTIYDKYLYYSHFNDKDKKFELYRATPDGNNPELLDDTYNYMLCGVVDNKLYLFRLKNESGSYEPGIIACDKDAVPLSVNNPFITFDIEKINSLCMGGGWLYISMDNNDGTEDLYRISLSTGTSKKILEGYIFNSLSYCEEWVYFRNGEYTDENKTDFEPSEVCFVFSDGTDEVLTY